MATPNFFGRFTGDCDVDHLRRWLRPRCIELQLIGTDSLAGKWKDDDIPKSDQCARKRLYDNLRRGGMQLTSYEALTVEQRFSLKGSIVDLKEPVSATPQEQRNAAVRAAYHAKKRKLEASAAAASTGGKAADSAAGDAPPEPQPSTEVIVPTAEPCAAGGADDSAPEDAGGSAAADVPEADPAPPAAHLHLLPGIASNGAETLDTVQRVDAQLTRLGALGQLPLTARALRQSSDTGICPATPEFVRRHRNLSGDTGICPVTPTFVQ
jgi:hypothetical protein